MFFVASRSGEVTSASILVKKLVAVLESTEKLPVFTYECPGSGLQVCVRGKYLMMLSTRNLFDI